VSKLADISISVDKTPYPKISFEVKQAAKAVRPSSKKAPPTKEDTVLKEKSDLGPPAPALKLDAP